MYPAQVERQCTDFGLNYNFLRLVDQLLDPFLDLFLVGILLCDLSDLLARILSSIRQSRDISRPPCVPLCDFSLTLSEFFSRSTVFFSRVFFVERSGMFLEFFSDFTLLIFAEQCGWSRSPQELFESVKLVGDELGSFKVPNLVSGFRLSISDTSLQGVHYDLRFVSKQRRGWQGIDQMDPIRYR